MSKINILIKKQLISKTTKQGLVVNIFGKKTDINNLICNYKRCHYKFSLHGFDAHVCRYQHLQNITIALL